MVNIRYAKLFKAEYYKTKKRYGDFVNINFDNIINRLKTESDAGVTTLRTPEQMKLLLNTKSNRTIELALCLSIKLLERI